MCVNISVNVSVNVNLNLSGASLCVRVRGVRFAWRSFPNGLYQKKAKIDLGVSSLGKIGEVGISRDHPVPVLLGARLGRGSLELVEIFQMSM